jgi:betaine lipid synthase
MNMYLSECTTVEYVAATFDPIVHRSLLKNDNYFYLLCLTGRYTSECCPDYLNPPVTSALKSSRALESFRIHTDTVEQVLGRLTQKTLTKAVLMDHMDWMDWDGVEVRKEVVALRKAMKPGGQVMFRSAAKSPWYVKVYEEEGFVCQPVSIRQDNSIDRINMYASTWIARLQTPPGTEVADMEVLQLPEASLYAI